MEAGPSPLAERIVRALVPPDRREEVLGDLQERFVSRVGWTADAIRIVPFVAWSEIRRTTPPALFAAQAAVLLASFVSAAQLLAPESFNRTDAALRLLVPVLSGLVGLALQDAFVTAARRGSMRMAGHTIGVFSIAAVESALWLMNSPLGLPHLVWASACTVGFVLLGFIRVTWNRRMDARLATVADLRSAHDQAIDLQWVLERLGLVSVGLMLVLASGVNAPVGFSFFVSGCGAFLAMVWNGRRFNRRLTRRRVGLDSETEVDAYRQELVRRRDTMTYWADWARPGMIAFLGVASLNLWMPFALSLLFSVPLPDRVKESWIWPLIFGVAAQSFWIGETLSARAERAYQLALDALDSASTSG